MHTDVGGVKGEFHQFECSSGWTAIVEQCFMSKTLDSCITFNSLHLFFCSFIFCLQKAMTQKLCS